MGQRKRGAISGMSLSSRGVYTTRESKAGKSELVAIQEQQFVSEDELQGLIAKHPALIAGDGKSGLPTEWLLVTREMGMPVAADGLPILSVDHLFIDKHAIPTIVETKLSRNPETNNNKIVGQALGYAAHSVFWESANISRAYYDWRRHRNIDESMAEQELLNFIGNNYEPTSFWEQVSANLRSGRLRIVLVSDSIPPRLRQTILFLNSQLNLASAFGVEVKRHRASTETTSAEIITSQVIGNIISSSPPPPPWCEHTFLAKISETVDSEVAGVAREIIEWAKRKRIRLKWGNGSINGSVTPIFMSDDRERRIVSLWTSGNVQCEFPMMMQQAPFTSEEKRREFIQRLNSATGNQLPSEPITGMPNFPLAELAKEKRLISFLDVLEWTIKEHQEVEVESTPAPA